MSDFELKLKIVNRNHQQILWQELRTYESALNDSEYVKSPYSEETKEEPVNRAKRIVKTKMTNNYANIQKNKQIFNAITKNTQFKQSTNKILLRSKGKTYAKSSRDLESMMKHIELKGIAESKP